jgi:hypothetical protein
MGLPSTTAFKPEAAEQSTHLQVQEPIPRVDHDLLPEAGQEKISRRNRATKKEVQPLINHSAL